VVGGKGCVREVGYGDGGGDQGDMEVYGECGCGVRREGGGGCGGGS